MCLGGEKMIIKTEQLTYNYLTFKKPTLNPEPFSMHCHTTYELIFFEKGEANYIIDENKYKLHKNDLIFIRPYKYHYIVVQHQYLFLPSLTIIIGNAGIHGAARLVDGVPRTAAVRTNQPGSDSFDHRP